MWKEMTEEQKLILLEINRLTEDEDLRQELWVQYLSTGGLPFSERLQKMNISPDSDQELAAFILELITSTSPNATQIQEVIASLTDLERSVMACLLIHLDIEQISQFKQISPIRILQVITTIRYNTKLRIVYEKQSLRKRI